MTPILREFTSATGDRTCWVSNVLPKMALRSTRDERGVALPVALLALVAVSILVTSLLLSSATEVSLSAAHQDATRGLFTAEGAIEAYVAQTGENLAPTPAAGVSYIPPGGTSRDEVTIRVEVLGNVPNKVTQYSTLTAWNDTTYAVTATPRRGGRQVVAMIDKVMEKFTVMIDAGLVSGDNVKVSGGALLSDGSDSQICADSVGGKAVQTTTNADTAKIEGSGRILGENEKITVPRGDLVKNIFGRTLEEMIASADIHLNSRDFKDDRGNVTHNVGKVTSFGGVGAPRPNMQNTPLNWGCPADMFADCQLPENRDADTTRLPVVAINASSTECVKVKGVETCDPNVWNTAIVDMSHAQGILIVYNGNFRVAGQFAFKGIIVVQGTFAIEGTSTTGPRVEGAVIGLGMARDGTQSTIADNTASGGATVRYNRCATNLVTGQIQENAPIRRMGGKTFGWFEVVR